MYTLYSHLVNELLNMCLLIVSLMELSGRRYQANGMGRYEANGMGLF